MEAIQKLIDEHRITKKVLDALEKGVLMLQMGNAVDPDLFTDAADFLNVFLDTCHIRKEEGVLFNALWRAGLNDACGPIGVNVMEHEVRRAYARVFTDAANRLKTGENNANAVLTDSAMKYISATQHHIRDEEQGLFACAERILPPALDKALMQSFAEIDREVLGEGGRERYLALADRIASKKLTVAG
jgi:hemerythrin-like domain-containing protein